MIRVQTGEVQSSRIIRRKTYDGEKIKETDPLDDVERDLLAPDQRPAGQAKFEDKKKKKEARTERDPLRYPLA